MKGPSHLHGDNLGIIQNATISKADLKKKHVAISCHVTREAVASGICLPMWLKSEHNHSDIMTKQIGSTAFIGHAHDCFWQPAHRAGLRDAVADQQLQV